MVVTTETNWWIFTNSECNGQKWLNYQDVVEEGEFPSYSDEMLFLSMGPEKR